MLCSVVIHFAHQLLDALAAVHHAGYVHGDISPRNIRVTPSGHIKLIDFGAALKRGACPHDSRIHGTPQYMSPEQARRRTVTVRSDLYSVGVILYELITGRHYRPRQRRAAMVHALNQRGEIPSLRSVQPLVPEGIEQFVQTLLAQDPSARYEHAEHAIAELRKVSCIEQADLALIAASTMKPPPRRYWRGLAAVAMALLMLGSGLALGRIVQPDDSNATPAQVDYVSTPALVPELDHQEGHEDGAQTTATKATSEPVTDPPAKLSRKRSAQESSAQEKRTAQARNAATKSRRVRDRAYFDDGVIDLRAMPRLLVPPHPEGIVEDRRTRPRGHQTR